MTLSPQQSLFQPVRFFPAEREVFRKKERLTPSEWAERYRRVTMGAHVGPWRNDLTPYLAFVMDTFMLPHVREGVICGSPQTGKTETPYNCLAYAMDRDPSTVMVVMPSREDARKVAEDRIIPMLNSSPRLSPLISENPDDTAKQRVRLRNGALLYMAWSNSASALATFPIKYLLFDETDKYGDTVGKETDPVTLGEKRARVFRYTHKIFKVSSPTRETGHIWRAIQRCEAVYHFHARCPDCGHEQPFHVEQLRYPEGLPAEEVHRDHLARYECRACHMQWMDSQRDAAVRAGKWTRVKGENISRPRRVGFHLPSWLSPDVSLSEIAAAEIRAKTDKAKLIDFYNDYLAEPYIEKQSERKEDAILALRDERPRGLVPKGISCLLLLADTQQRGFYYEVRAFGWGPSLDSWQVREGFVESFKGLEDVLYNSEYADCDGVKHSIGAAFIDSGGGTGAVPKHSRTAEVYDFCRQHPKVKPIKGRQRMTQTVSQARIDNYPGTRKPIPGGVVLHHVNVTHFKDELARKLAIHRDDPGAWRLHSECPVEYARHMTAEYKDEKGLWQCPKGKANHYWDIGVYALAAAEILQVKFWSKPDDTQGQEEKRAANNRDNRRRGRW
ncbi:MAG: phage terminase large subunit family protein [Deltaproteobacteria bacterium]|nr:phage terminase large subunit family protein [Deltaproteobacteria bacterium]MCL4873847.1 phage terminase large subunit family protein [bacterium]